MKPIIIGAFIAGIIGSLVTTSLIVKFNLGIGAGTLLGIFDGNLFCSLGAYLGYLIDLKEQRY